MPTSVPSPSASTTAATPPPAPNPASTTSTTATTSNTNTPSKPPSQKPQNTKWQAIKSLLPSSGIQTFMGFVGLILAIVGIPWAMRTYNMARWTELKDFRDDCRSVQASGATISTACGEALGKELEPPPYAPTHFSRLGKRAYTDILSEAIQPRLRRLLVFFQNIGIQKLTPLLFHPWTFNGALLLLSTARLFRYNMIGPHFGFLAAIITILLIHHLILWPIWCDDCHGLSWKFITRVSDTACVAFIFTQTESIKYHYSPPYDLQSYVVYRPVISVAIIKLEHGYVILLLLEGFRRSYTVFGIVLASAVRLHIWLHYFFFAKSDWSLENMFLGLWLVLGVLATELCFVIVLRAETLLFGKTLLLAFYGGIIWKMYETIRRGS